ncbi:conserved hypothetical protein [Paecilomyces variotii No. 5]|uniref:Ribosome maturation protein SDO1/SBDS N-terminal domain-containing protein n=1 Tax=Byssochlamys spectabilis (strain No. 5 / NBRC 109023) TaxID=1356009 RepID=V5F9S1_BYSSN|nr:conserved hypothetical protein [Paecilomyces variotii No. 5]
MPRANEQQSRVFYKGKVDDFVIFVDDAQALNNWRKDRTIPLAQVVSGWKIFVTHRHGAQGVLDTASNGSLESEFGTHNEDEVVKQILEKGELQQTVGRERQGDKNPSDGPSVPH